MCIENEDGIVIVPAEDGSRYELVAYPNENEVGIFVRNSKNKDDEHILCYIEVDDYSEDMNNIEIGVWGKLQYTEEAPPYGDVQYVIKLPDRPKIKRYYLNVTDTRTFYHDVEAENDSEAEEIMKSMYHCGELDRYELIDDYNHEHISVYSEGDMYCG